MKKMTTAKKKNYSCGDTEASTVGLERGGVGEGGAGRGGEEQEIEERRKRTPATVCENKRR